jgi:hypothetical protein
VPSRRRTAHDRVPGYGRIHDAHRRARRAADGRRAAGVRDRHDVHPERRAHLAVLRGGAGPWHAGDRHPPRAVGHVRRRGVRQADAAARARGADRRAGRDERRVRGDVGGLQRCPARRARRPRPAGSLGRGFAAGVRPRPADVTDHQARRRPCTTPRPPARSCTTRSAPRPHHTAGRSSSTSRSTCSDRARATSPKVRSSTGSSPTLTSGAARGTRRRRPNGRRSSSAATRTGTAPRVRSRRRRRRSACRASSTGSAAACCRPTTRTRSCERVAC